MFDALPRVIKVELCSRLFLYILEKKNKKKAKEAKTALNVYRGIELMNTTVNNLSLVMKLAAIATSYSASGAVLYLITIFVVNRNITKYLAPKQLTDYLHELCRVVTKDGLSYLNYGMLSLSGMKSLSNMTTTELSDWKNIQTNPLNITNVSIPIDFMCDEIDLNLDDCDTIIINKYLSDKPNKHNKPNKNDKYISPYKCIEARIVEIPDDDNIEIQVDTFDEYELNDDKMNQSFSSILHNIIDDDVANDSKHSNNIENNSNNIEKQSDDVVSESNMITLSDDDSDNNSDDDSDNNLDDCSDNKSENGSAMNISNGKNEINKSSDKWEMSDQSSSPGRTLRERHIITFHNMNGNSSDLSSQEDKDYENDMIKKFNEVIDQKRKDQDLWNNSPLNTISKAIPYINDVKKYSSFGPE